jgi:glycosyltransferase involved in cell wall biosynthesis
VPGARFFVTGNPKHLDPALKAQMPANMTLTGFLSDEGYGSLISGADAVLTLTTRNHTMLRGAYEAIYQGTPVIVSDWPLLRESFPDGAVHVDNSPAAIAAAVDTVRREPARFKAGAARLAAAKLARWSATKQTLSAIGR